MIRVTQLRSVPGQSLVSNDAGDYMFLPSPDADKALQGTIGSNHERFDDLRSRGLLKPNPALSGLEYAVQRTRKHFLAHGPSLHIFVVTLRCDHSCQYCQVSRASLEASGRDMSTADAMSAVERVFESTSLALTIEFQGGEPALRFDLIRTIVIAVEARNATEQRHISFSMATTLDLLKDDDLVFCRDHRIHLSTSVDGPAETHNRQRPNPTRDSWQKTRAALDVARSIVGFDGVAALPTFTRDMAKDPLPVINAYLELGFRSIFFRPISPYGFARKTRQRIGLPISEFADCYERLLNIVLRLNEDGIEFTETYAAILLRHILTPFHSGYTDIRSPTGAGLGVLVYNYDGRVYPSDEARMAAETGDGRFALGGVMQPLDELLASPAMSWLMGGAVAETMPGCSTCAFVPFCGADPVHHAATQGSPVLDQETSEFCSRQMAVFNVLFRHLSERKPEVMKTFLAWAMQKPRSEISDPGWIEA